MSGVRPGRYEISAELAGFKKFTTQDIGVGVGQTPTVNITLAVGGVTEQVVVTGETPLIDLTSNEVGGNISNRDLVELPSVNRNFIGFVGLLPGIVANISTGSFGSDSINVNGQDSRNNNHGCGTVLGGANGFRFASQMLPHSRAQ